MDPEKIGKFILELRKEKNLSQYQLADMIPISRQAVSKWERGKTTPDTQTLLTLSKLFNVSINELLTGERLLDDTKEELEETTLSILDESNKKSKKIKRISIISITTITILLLAFLLYYFVNSYSTTQVYTISGKNKSFITYDGLMLITKEKFYLKLGKLKNNSGYEINKLKLYYKHNNKNKLMVEDRDIDNLVIRDNIGYYELLKEKNIEKIINNLYLEVTYDTNKTDIIKLDLMKDFDNNNLFFSKQTKSSIKPIIKPNGKENLNNKEEEKEEEIQPVVQEIEQSTKDENNKQKETEKTDENHETEITQELLINKIKEKCNLDMDSYMCDFDNSNIMILYDAITNKISIYKNYNHIGDYQMDNDRYDCKVENCENIFDEVTKKYLIS